MTDGVDNSRRHFLSVTTAVVGGVGAAAALAPFLISLKPSATGSGPRRAGANRRQPHRTGRDDQGRVAGPAGLGVEAD